MKTPARQGTKLGIQLLFGLSLLAITIALVAGSVIHRAERNYLSELVREEKVKIFELIMSSTLDDVISEDLPEIETIMRQVIEQDPELIALHIENESGSRLFQWRLPSESQREPGQMPGPNLAFWVSGDRELSLVKPIELAGETFGHIMAVWDVSRSNREVARHTFLIVLAVGGVCGLLSILVFFLVEGFAVRPINRISNRVREFRDGIYDRRVDLPQSASEELSQLNQSVDALGQFLVERERREAELEEARDLAEAANRAKTAFLANMSHELRTPLNAINGFSEMMSIEIFGPLGDQRYREYAEQINASGDHLLAIINDILDVSKIEAGKGELQIEEVDVREIFLSGIELVRARAEEGELDLVVTLADDLPILCIDGRRMRQVLLNLLSNAVKFTPKGGHVAVEARWSDHDGLVVEVSDTGIGIAADSLLTVLEPFGQIESAYARQYEGTGLGLPLAKALVEIHGGELSLESQPDVGTTARFTLPADLAVSRPGGRADTPAAIAG
jgi:signal transduction histidine kinase